MKTFAADFFNIENFIKERIDFNYSTTDEGAYHIAYNVNDGFIHIMGVSIVSVLENNKSQNFVFHIFVDSYSQKNIERIESMAKQWQCHCIVYLLHMEPFNDFHIKVERFSRITYARIYMPKVIHNLTDRVIYLDADTMVCDSLHELWNMDLQGYAIGAVSDVPETVDFRSKYLKLKSGKYFNDGVMVINVRQWEENSITERAFSYQNEPRSRFKGQDQDIMNLVVDGDLYFLPVTYNAYGGGYGYEEKVYIAHWSGRRKPWQMVITDFDEKWRHYNALAPWDTIINILPERKPENYHDFKEWGHHNKSKGNYVKYLEGIFWYSVLRVFYKLGGKKKN
ncbi:glycosyltransferase family 8 protein [Veillonella ratti]|uniref:glycosyltransferase family 8 protein n=1 Tax=Veillonella ratti TaxID=103892 RepID=UPI000F8EC9D3|nr:glycosyltransferase family 8 protein [Veillonella ratti]